VHPTVYLFAERTVAVPDDYAVAEGDLNAALHFIQKSYHDSAKHSPAGCGQVRASLEVGDLCRSDFAPVFRAIKHELRKRNKERNKRRLTHIWVLSGGRNDPENRNEYLPIPFDELERDDGFWDLALIYPASAPNFESMIRPLWQTDLLGLTGYGSVRLLPMTGDTFLTERLRRPLAADFRLVRIEESGCGFNLLGPDQYLFRVWFRTEHAWPEMEWRAWIELQPAAPTWTARLRPLCIGCAIEERSRGATRGYELSEDWRANRDEAGKLRDPVNVLLRYDLLSKDRYSYPGGLIWNSCLPEGAQAIASVMSIGGFGFLPHTRPAIRFKVDLYQNGEKLRPAPETRSGSKGTIRTVESNAPTTISNQRFSMG
jgi:hypothetical protein